MAFDPNKITYFAQTDARGKNVRFGIKAKDRQRHVYIIGKTGMGKSTLLENMAVQDIQNGEGMAFIDPHGSAAETLLNYIPEHRINDVLYFAPFDTDNPISFNVMEDVGPDKRHLVVSGLMSVFKKIWVDAWSARMEYILSNTLLALLEYPDSTLLGVNRMLSDKAYRDLVVANVKDPSVRSFWVDEFAKYNERYMQEAGDAIKNKIGQFTSNPVIRNIVGQSKSSFDIRKMMDDQKILIINLSKGLIGESNANLLGSMLTTRIYLAAMSRADLPLEKMRDMPNFYFYVDEFQSFANATFANILSEARKYHLNLTIAHQYIEQMEEEVRNAVFGNVGTIIAFRVGPFDAETLEPIFTPQFTAVDIVNLSYTQIYLTLMIDGIGSQPFSATTLPPITPPAQSYRDVAIAASRKQFTKLRAEVEEGVHKFHEPISVPKREPREMPREGMQTGAPRPRVAGEVRPTRHSEGVRTERPRRVETEQTPRYVASEQIAPQNVAPAPRAHAPRPRTEFSDTRAERAPVPREPRTQTAHDLRTVLKRIVQATDDAATNGTTEGKHEAKRDRAELKGLLRNVLSQELQKGSEATVEESAPPKAVPTEPVSEPQPTMAHTQTPSVEEKREPVPRPETHTKTQSGSITPKQLEHMMRVTTSDKPPV